MRDAQAIKAACDKARELAVSKPGRYGGRYVAERYNPNTKRQDVIVLDDDDPDRYRDDETLDIFAQATPTKVYGIGRARHWLLEDGTVRSFLSDERGLQTAELAILAGLIVAGLVVSVIVFRTFILHRLRALMSETVNGPTVSVKDGAR